MVTKLQSLEYNYNVNDYMVTKGCKRKNVASADLSPGKSYTAANRSKVF